MSGIQTGIELNDQFSSVIYGIISAVNIAVSSMESMQNTMNADVDTSGIEGIRESLNEATVAMDQFNAAMARQNVPDALAPQVAPGGQEVINVEVEPIIPDPLVENPDPIPVEVLPNAPPDPVDLPVTWNVDNMADVFTGTGIDRFRQEVSSAESMLQQLNATQDAVAEQAWNTNIFPPQAAQDLNSLAVRIDMIRDRINQITSNPMNVGTDEANAGLEELRSQLADALSAQDDLNRAVQNMDVERANAAYLNLSRTVGNTERYIRDNVNEQGQFNSVIEEGNAMADQLTRTIKGAVGAYLSIATIGKALNISDELTTTTARLDMMNDGLQSTEELTNMVYAAAQDARGSFSDMADVVARFGNNAKDAFSSSEEVVAFADLVQKQMTIAGAGTTEASNAMLQLSQALGSGVLRGDELNSIFEQAPNLIQSIANYLDVPIGTIREMASEGELTADVVKAAIFASADEINAKFNEMPQTWGQIWQGMQNTALVAFRPVLQRLNDIANSKAFQTFVNGAIEAMAVLAGVLLDIFDMVSAVGQVVADNWSWISPIIYGVIAALAVYAIYLGIVKGIELASAAAAGIMAVGKGLVAAATMIATGATWAQTTAQMGLNAAMYACPIVWILALIIALIAAIYAIAGAISKITGVFISGTGLILSLIFTASAIVWNIFVGLYNALVEIFVALWNLIIDFVEFFANVWSDPIGSIIRLFLGLADAVLGVLAAIASAIDAVFGSNLADAVHGWQAGLGDIVEASYGEDAVELPKMVAEETQLDRWSYEDAVFNGMDLGNDFENWLSDSFDGFMDDLAVDIPNADDYTNGFADVIASSGMGDNLSDIAGDTGNISDSLDITSEDLKYLRDIAEQDAINRFTTAEISIEQNNTNQISNGMDLDGVVSGLTDAVNEAVDIMTEGVHE